MAKSTCPKCWSMKFEVREAPVETLTGATYTVSFVQCAACGAAIGVFQPELAGYLANIWAKVQKL